MSLKRRQFSHDFKLRVLCEIEAGKSMAQASREYQISPSLISRWHKQHREYQGQAFGGNGNMYKYEARIAELERMGGQLTMDNALVKKALQRLEERVRLSRGVGGK